MVTGSMRRPASRFGHRRLAIVDLSPTGVQPMASADGRFVITYNGELYNTAEMAADLAHAAARTSDTEVLVESLAKFGIERNARQGQRHFRVRGVRPQNPHAASRRVTAWASKPLYWTRQGGTFAFASELKALRAVASLSFALDLESLSLYLRHACVPAPRTIYRAVQQADARRAAGSHARLARRQRVTGISARSRARASRGSIRRSEAEIVEELDGLLADSVERQMVSDVPLGAFLSGGIDSSTVVALMQRADAAASKPSPSAFRRMPSTRPIMRAPWPSILRTDHTELILSAAEAQAIIPQLPAIYDEPFADASQLPTYLVSRLARSDVTVALSGDGGDELFGGYVRYQGVSRMWQAMRLMPHGARRLAAGAVGMASPEFWDALAAPVPRRLEAVAFRRQDGERRAASFGERPGRYVPAGDFPMARSRKPVADDAGTAGLGRRARFGRGSVRCGRQAAPAGYAGLPAGRHPDQGRSRLDGRSALRCGCRCWITGWSSSLAAADGAADRAGEGSGRCAPCSTAYVPSRR